jgi:hypothetical protein
MLVVALGAACVLFGVAALFVYAAGRARARALAEDVRANVEPYLRRKAAEQGHPAEAPTWTSRTSPEEIVTYSARLSALLLERERAGVPTGNSGDPVAYAQTQPVSASDEILVKKNG